MAEGWRESLAQVREALAEIKAQYGEEWQQLEEERQARIEDAHAWMAQQEDSGTWEQSEFERLVEGWQRYERAIDELS